MSLHVHRAERTDTLAHALGGLLRVPPADPFTPDVVSVPTPGIERFLAQTLGRHLGTSADPMRADGVCANVRFPSPAALVDAVLQAGSAPGTPPPGWAEDPWRPGRSVWPLLGVIDDSAGEQWCLPLARHLGLVGERPDTWDRTTRRFATAARLAALFASYAGQRPSLLLDWLAGGSSDGTGQPLDEDQRWQPELWRRLRTRIGAPSPAERLEAAARAIEGDPRAVDLPERLHVFGASRLPADQLRVLSALARGREVHLWLADASPALWPRLAAQPASATGPAAIRADDRSAALVAHPLLRSLGRDTRELALRLSPLLAEGGTDEHLTSGGPSGAPPSRAAGSPSRPLLRRLQADLVADRAPRADPGDPLPAGDLSVQVHGCHGAGRQAEVLREAILTLLADDPTLQPRDILVMCPDLATFAPLLDATFAATGPGTPLADLRVRIADRSPEQDNEVLTTLGVALDLVAGRVLRSELLDLVSRPPVRTRFGLSDRQVERLEGMAERVGVRWGLDGRTRADYALPGIESGTWAWAVDRLLLGVALSEEDLAVVGGVLPFDDVPNGDIELVGALAEVVASLQRLRDAAGHRAPLATWIETLSTTVTDLMDARGLDSWQVPHALASLAGLAHSAEEGGPGPDLALPDVRWLIGDLLAGRPSRSNFRSGGLTVCGLLPMRSVPHRVICLVGLDDGAFPRSPVPDGDDVLARRPCVGERDLRSEDRQVLLDAIMAATDHLVITYTAADDRTNAPAPPCVPLGELLDALDRTAAPADGFDTVRDHVLHKHPLQPFDARNFRPQKAWSAPFSHDRAALAAAQAAQLPRVGGPGLAPDLLPPVPLGEVTLDELVEFLGSPPRWFLRTRLGLRVSADREPADESLPYQLDGLGRWAVGERIIDLAGRRGLTHDAIGTAEAVRGTLPYGEPGLRALRAVGDDAVDVVTGMHAAQGGEPARIVPVSLDRPAAHVLGTVTGLHGDSLVMATFSSPKPKHIFALWVPLLALAVADPTGSPRATLVTKRETLHLAAPPPHEAARILDELLDLLADGGRSPLPLFPASAQRYAEQRQRGRPAAAALEEVGHRSWANGFGAEQALPEAVSLYGPQAKLTAVTAAPPLPGESWFPDETTRFGQLSRRLWSPILDARRQGDALARARGAGSPTAREDQ